MAFPTIADADTKSGTVATNSASWTLTYPTNIASGDLLILLAAVDGVPNPTLPAGWVVSFFGSPAGANRIIYAKKKADGTETGTFSLGLSAAEQGGWRIFRIPAAGWEGTLGATVLSGAADFQSDNTGSPSANPDPPALDPTDWATEDTLWIVACSVDTSRTISVYPYAGRNTADVSGGSGGATLGVCTTTSAVSSLNPGTFTVSASDDWAAVTVAIRPASSVPVHERSAAINGTGAVTVAAFQETLLRSAAVAAVGAATVAAFRRDLQRAAVVNAAGAVVTSGTFFSILERSAAVSATGAIASSGTVSSGAVTHERSAAVAATAGIASSATFWTTFARTAALDATGSIASSATFYSILTRSAALAATAAIQSAATFLSIIERASSLSATGAIASAGMRELLRSAALGAVASLQAAGVFLSIFARSAALSATGAITSAGLRIVSRSTELNATAGIASDRELVLFRSSTLTATAGIAVDGSAFEPGVIVSSAELIAVASISTVPAPAHNRAAALNATATITSSGSITVAHSRAVLVNATATITSSAAPSHNRSAALVAFAEIVARGVVPTGEIIEFPTGYAPIIANPSVPRIVGAGTTGRIERRDTALIGGPS